MLLDPLGPPKIILKQTHQLLATPLEKISDLAFPTTPIRFTKEAQEEDHKMVCRGFTGKFKFFGDLPLLMSANLVNLPEGTQDKAVFTEVVAYQKKTVAGSFFFNLYPEDSLINLGWLNFGITSERSLGAFLLKGLLTIFPKSANYRSAISESKTFDALTNTMNALISVGKITDYQELYFENPDRDIQIKENELPLIEQSALSCFGTTPLGIFLKKVGFKVDQIEVFLFDGGFQFDYVAHKA